MRTDHEEDDHEEDVVHRDEVVHRTVTPILQSMKRQLAALRVLLEREAGEALGDTEQRSGHAAGHAEDVSTRPGSPVTDKLTAREREVLNLLVKGASNDVIARSLGIAVRTVKAHLGSIFSKLDVSGRAEAIVRVLSEEDGRPSAASTTARAGQLPSGVQSQVTYM